MFHWSSSKRNNRSCVRLAAGFFKSLLPGMGHGKILDPRIPKRSGHPYDGIAVLLSLPGYGTPTKRKRATAMWGKCGSLKIRRNFQQALFSGKKRKTSMFKSQKRKLRAVRYLGDLQKPLFSCLGEKGAHLFPIFYQTLEGHTSILLRGQC